MQINEQIALFRKRAGMTQEALAQALGVTNQAVSKWESNQCCPDIQLLPPMARLFGVSVDALLGCAEDAPEPDLIPAMRRKIESLPVSEAHEVAYNLAAALHVLLFAKSAMAQHQPGGLIEDHILQAGRGEWGYSCLNVDNMATAMRGGAVFFSRNLPMDHLQSPQIWQLAALLRPFTDADTLRAALAVHRLTFAADDAYASLPDVAQKSGLAEDKVRACLTGALARYLEEKEGAFRFCDMYLHVLPILSLLAV